MQLITSLSPVNVVNAALFAGDGSVIEGSGSSGGDGMFNS